MKDLTKEELENTLELVSDEVRKIKKEYVCGHGEHGDGLTAEEGFEELIERIEKIKKKKKEV